ncbi:SCP domain-containing protein [Plasmodiophora brassicae]
MRSAWAVLATATLLAVRLEALIAGVTPQQIVDLLNSARANVVPTAAHMVKLEWDDTLAAAAASYAATQCSAQFSGQGPSCPNCVSWTADAELPSYGSHGILDVIAGNFIAAKSQWPCTQSGSTLTCTCPQMPCWDDWNTVVNDAATAVGCGDKSAAACGWKYNIYVCAYNGWTSDAHPYTPSVTNSSCTQGTCPLAYPLCVNGLCTKPVTKTTTLGGRVSHKTTKGVPAAQKTTSRRIAAQQTSAHAPVTKKTTRGVNGSTSRKRTDGSVLNPVHVASSSRPGAPKSTMPTTLRRPLVTSQGNAHVSQPISTTGQVLSSRASSKAHSPSAGAEVRAASASNYSIVAGISNTVLYIIGAVALACCTATITTICMRKQAKHGTTFVPAVQHHYLTGDWRGSPMSIPPSLPGGSLAAPVAPVPMHPALLNPTAPEEPASSQSESPSGYPSAAAVPKSIRRLQKRGIAKDKFNQGAMTMTVSDGDTMF